MISSNINDPNQVNNNAGGNNNYTPKRHRMKGCFRTYGADYICLAIIGALSILLFASGPLHSRVFLIGSNGAAPSGDGFPRTENLVSNDISYPKVHEYISTVVAGVISFSFSMIIITIMQIWVRSLSDYHRAFLGLLIALLGGSFFQVVIKWAIGGNRPNFLAICKPDYAKIGTTGIGYGGIYYDRSICTGDKTQIDDGLSSFPSGHSNGAFASLLFLTFYLNGKLKLLFCPYRGQFWKLIVVFIVPILGAVLISLSRLVDYSHHWYDIFAGAVIGIFFAFFAYSTQYCSIWNPLNNHLPAKRYGAPYAWEMNNANDTPLSPVDHSHNRLLDYGKNMRRRSRANEMMPTGPAQV